MDIRDILKSFDQLSEATTTTDKGVTTHKGDYGREFDTDDEGNPVVKKVKSTEPKPKGRRPDPDKPKTGKDDPKNKKVGDIFGRTTGAVPKGKKGAQYTPMKDADKAEKKAEKAGKKGLKEYFDQMDEALYEAALAVQPLPATPQQKQQQQMAGKPAFMIKSTEPGNPNMPVITTQNPEVVKAAQTGGITIQKPGAATTAPGATPAAGAGSQVKPMEEGGDVGKHNNANTGFDALVRKLTPKYGKEAATKIAGAQLKKMSEAETPPTAFQSSPLTFEGKKGVNPFAKKDTKKKPDENNNNIPDYAEDGKGKNDLKKKGAAPKKGVNPFAKKTEKKKVKEGMTSMKNTFVILDDSLLDQIANMNGAEVDPDAGTVETWDENTFNQLNAFSQKNPTRLKRTQSINTAGMRLMARPVGGTASGPEYNLKEGMEHHLQAARLEGKSHALRKMPYNCTHDDMEEARCYHDGFKEGLDECYGQMSMREGAGLGAVGAGVGALAAGPVGAAIGGGLGGAMEESEIGRMASYGAHTVDEGMGDDIVYDQYCSHRDEGKTHEQAVAAIAQRYGDKPQSVEYAIRGYPEYAPKTFGRRIKSAVKSAFGMGEGEIDEMDKTSYMKQQAIKTPGGTFKAFGQTMRDSNVLDEFAFEALDKQLNAILEGKEVSEGMTVSISKGQQGAPDSVSVSAQDGEADQLLSIIKSAGMGLFGGEEKGFNAPQGGTGAHGGINVVDDHDGMMALMRKLSGAGGEMPSGGDYESEEGHERHGEEDHMHGEEETCNECGGMMEENHQCGSQEMVDEVETPDQEEFEVVENAPDSGADNTNADVADQVGSDDALAKVDAAQNMASPTNEAEDETGEEAGKEEEKKEMSESSFFNLFKKISMLSEESTSEKDDKAEKAGKKVTKDIEYDDKKDKKEKKLDEWANEAGKNGTDASFEADIDFMTKVISGGLNKQKSTGQTTIPVINGQKSRMGVDGLGSPMKESNDLLKDYRKLSGL